MSDLVTAVIRNAMGPFVFAAALILFTAVKAGASDLLVSAESLCDDSILVSQSTSLKFSDEVTASSIKGELVSRPAYRVTVQNTTNYTSYRFFSDGGILITSGLRNPDVASAEPISSLVYSFNDAKLGLISGKYTSDFEYDSNGTLAEVVYTQINED